MNSCFDNRTEVPTFSPTTTLSPSAVGGIPITRRPTAIDMIVSSSSSSEDKPCKGWGPCWGYDDDDDAWWPNWKPIWSKPKPPPPQWKPDWSKPKRPQWNSGLGHSNLGSYSSQSQEKDHIHGETTSHIMKRDGRAAAVVVVLTTSMVADGYYYPQMIMLQTLAAVALVVLQKMVGNLLALHGIHGSITALGRVANREVKLASNGMMI